MGWLVVRTHTHKETWACENIMRQGANLYLPRISERVKVRGVTEERTRCLFPSYVFVETNGQWRFLLSTFGVLSVIMQGGTPASVQESVIDDLRSREDGAGLVILPERPQEGRRRLGEKVRVVSGAFSGYEGIYEGAAPQERLRVLLDYLGRKTRVLIGNEQLESVE